MTIENKLSLHNRRLSGIEAARGIAAIMVVFYHAARHLKSDYGFMPWYGVSQFGHAGVDFFFVLSGFIIFFVHSRDLGCPSRIFIYFERRYIRIYPLFWFSLIVGLALVALSSKKNFPSFKVILEHATLLPFGGEVGVAWTLQHEIVFYLIFATAIINRKLGVLTFVSWFSFIFISWSMGYGPLDLPLLSTLASMFNLEFFFGMLSAYLISVEKIKRVLLIFIVGVITFCSFALAENLNVFNGYAASAQIAYGLSSMLIVIGLAGTNLKGYLNSPTVLKKIGKASYSIYLLHLPCIGVIYKLLAISKLQTFLSIEIIYPVISCGAILTCIVISKFIEYPLMNMVRGFNIAVFRLFSNQEAKSEQTL
jgi:exopolysaccharide production protein ExoZ